MAGLDHVKHLLVRRKAQAVGAGQVTQRQRHAAIGRIDAIDGVRQFGRGFVAFPVPADAERRVGEPDRAIALADDVVG
ncbi:hypothetical protein D3C85_1773640 [compost metagenome]